MSRRGRRRKRSKRRGRGGEEHRNSSRRVVGRKEQEGEYEEDDDGTCRRTSHTSRAPSGSRPQWGCEYGVAPFMSTHSTRLTPHGAPPSPLPQPRCAYGFAPFPFSTDLPRFVSHRGPRLRPNEGGSTASRSLVRHAPHVSCTVWGPTCGCSGCASMASARSFRHAPRTLRVPW